MRASLGPVAACAVLCAAFVVPGTAAAARGTSPDLVVASVSGVPRALDPGDRFRIGDTVRNRGGRGARGSRVGYYLSADHRLDAKDVRLPGGRAVKRLGAGSSSQGAATLIVPAGIATRSYRLLACADALRRVAEGREGNNCRASAGRISVAHPPGKPAIREQPAQLVKSPSARFTFSRGTVYLPVQFRCSLDEGPFAPCSSPVEYSGLGEGAHTFAVKARDRDGRESPTTSVHWRIDATAPPTPVLTGGPAEHTNATTATLAFAGREDGARLECTLDWGPVSVCGSPLSFAGLSEGRHVFAVRARDGANNESSFELYAWTVDVTPPARPTITSAPPALSGSSSASISFSSGETGVVHHCSVDGGGFASCSSPHGVSGLRDGSHSFAVKARDAAGNESQPATHGWRSDTGPPTVTLAARPADPTNATAARFEFSASEEISSYRCRLDGAPFSSCASPAVYSGPLPEGTHTFVVEATDAVGHKGSTSFQWRVDTIPPQLGELTSFPENPTNERSARFTFRATESGLLYLCRLDGAAAFSACTNPQDYSGLADGAHRLEAKARDAAGNDSAVRVHRWLVDNTPPPAPGLQLGLFREGGPSGIAGFETWLGRRIDWALQYIPGQTWQSISTPDLSAWSLSRYRVIYSTPMLPASGATLDEGARGDYDAHFRKLAQTLVSYGQGNAVIRLGWEFNGNWFPWKARGKTTEFIAYWRRIVTTMRSVSPSLQFDWNPAHGPNDMPADTAYPGDSYVDYIGLVVFDHSWDAGYHDPILRWRNFVGLPFGMQWHRDFALAHGKPMTYPEWGLTFRDDFPGHGGGDDPYYVRKMYQWLNGSPVAYATYYEHDIPGAVRHSMMAGHFPNATALFKQLLGGS